jgi:hypothetical protein
MQCDPTLIAYTLGIRAVNTQPKMPKEYASHRTLTKRLIN